MFGDDSVEQYSEIVNIQFDNLAPNWFNGQVQLSELQDDTLMFQLGYEQLTEFVTFDKGSARASAWNVHPSVSENHLYKFTSYEVNIN